MWAYRKLASRFTKGRRSGHFSGNPVYRPEPTSHQRRLPGQLTREFTALLADTAGGFRAPDGFAD
jgi:hypothetical protein